MLAGNMPALFSSAAPVSQGNDTFTKLLLHFDAVGNTANIVDSSPAQHGYASITGTGLALSNGTGYFGPSSLYNPANSYFCFQSPVTDFDFGSGDFTIDWWEYRLDAADSRPIGCRNVDGTVYQPWMIYSSGGSVLFYASSNNASWDICNGMSVGTITAGVWTHRAIVRKGSTFYGFKDGVLQATATSAVAMRAGNAGSGPMIGLWVATSTYYYYNGHIDEFRISKGIARWIANFTKPAIPYAPDAPATHFTVSAPASANVNTAFNVTVTALTASNFLNTSFSGTVHITCTDGAAILPADATLVNGVGTFSVTIKTAGTFTVTAASGAVTGTSGSITASTGPSSPQTIFRTTSGNWTVPADWTSNNSIECIGGGGGAFGAAAGGGAYSKKSNLALTPGQVISITVGGGGVAGGVGGTSVFGASVCVAVGGGAGTTHQVGCCMVQTVGAGGAAGSGVGDIRYSGGGGGTGSGGGGGSGGPFGNGGAGGDGGGGGGGGTGGGAFGGAGGNNHLGTGGGFHGPGSNGGGGGAQWQSGCCIFGGYAGGNGTDWDATHGSGGGGGASGGVGGNGGLYGGGAAWNQGGVGAQGIVVIKYQ